MDVTLSSVQSDGNDATSAATFRYKHTPLDISRDQFRVLKILPHDNGKIRCAVHTYDRKASPPYVALSYAWGDTTDTQNIYINGNVLPVTRNLYSFLELQASWQLSSFDCEPPYFWIDQITIDQSSALEKNDQVQKMAAIFSEAIGVVAWLGTGDDHVRRGFDVIRVGAHALHDLFDKDGFIKPQLSSADNKRIQDFVDEHRDYFQNLESINNRSYWHRVWTVQEFALARNLYIMCGEDLLAWEDMDKFMWQTSFHPVPNSVSTHAPFNLHCLLRRIHVAGLEPNYFMRTLFVCMELNCADQRDLIYGLLGLFEKLDLQVDYSKSSQEVYWQLITVAKTYKDWAQGIANHNQHWNQVKQLGQIMGVPLEELESSKMLKKPRSRHAYYLQSKVISLRRRSLLRFARWLPERTLL